MIVLSERKEKSGSPSLAEQPGRVAAGECHGTFGELIQGVLPNDRHFLVTLPIDIKAVVEYKATDMDMVQANLRHKSKSIAAVTKYLRMHDLPAGGYLRFRSSFTAGKGLASSSADMVAALRAVARYFDLAVSPQAIETILRDIEPTDGVMYDGVVSYFHREVRLDEKIGATPRLTIVSADRGGECDTIQFNRRKPAFSAKTRSEYADMLVSVKSAIRDNDLHSLGRLTTRSCELSQGFNPHPHYALMNQLCVETDALGLVATHSGTCIGLLYDLNDPQEFDKTGHALISLASRHIECNKYWSI
jgi:uncharacterized protein involved in propanediol utilization